MTITVTTQNPNTAHEDIKLARRKIEDLFMEFIQNDGSKAATSNTVDTTVIEVPLRLQRDLDTQRALFCKYTSLCLC